MHTYRNILKVWAGVLMMVSLPAGAQALGGNLGGVASGSLGGRLGGTEIGGAAAATGNARFDASGTLGAVRHQVRHADRKVRVAADETAVAARSRIDSTRDTADASVATAQAAGVQARHRAVRSAALASTSVEAYGVEQTRAQPRGGIEIAGSGGVGAEQHAAGRSTAVHGAAVSQTDADRSGLSSSTFGAARLSSQKDEPAPAETRAH